MPLDGGCGCSLRKGLTIITNAVHIAMKLSHRDDLEVIVTGGWLSGAWFALVASGAIQSAGELFVDLAFDDRTGAQDDRRADHRKLGVVGTALICPASDITTLITDRAATDEAVARFFSLGLEVVRA